MKNDCWAIAFLFIQACLIIVTISVLRADLPDVRVGYFAELVLILQVWFMGDEIWRWRLRRRDWQRMTEAYTNELV